jgi:hypothetical protein
MARYRRIRETDDIDSVADNSGYPREVVEVAKQNLFMRQHEVAVAPGQVVVGYFTPDRRIGDLWERAASGVELDTRQETRLWSLLAHEYVEAKLMEAGLPYLSATEGAFAKGTGPVVGRENPSAHHTAPLTLRDERIDLLRHWDGDLALPRDGLRVAKDLSNLDEVVRVAKEGWGL